jgi:O-antigen ligase
VKFKRWTTLLQNQVVAVVLMLLFLVPMLFASADVRRIDQLTAYGMLGLLLLSVWVFRLRDRITLDRVRAFLLSGPNLPIVLYLVWGGVSAATSSEPFYSNVALVQLAFGTVVYGVTVYQFRRREQVRALLSSVLLVGVVLVVAALAIDRGHQLRSLAGAFHDRQLFGAFLSLILPVVLGVASGTRQKLLKLAATTACILIGGALLMTTCRSSWLGLLTALGIFGVLSLVFVFRLQSFATRKHELLVTPALALAAIGIFVFFTQTAAPISMRAATVQNLQQDDSVKDRLKLWNVGLRVLEARPLTGWGPGTYALAQERFSPDSRSREIILQMGPALNESPHNTYIQIAAELGLIGLAFYLAILAMFFYRGVRALPRMERGLRQFTLIGALAAIAGQCVDGIGNPAYLYPEVSTFFWLILGIGMCAAGVGQEVDEDTSARDDDGKVLGVPMFLYRGMRKAIIFCAILWIGAQLLNLDTMSAASAGNGKVAKIGAPHRPIYCDFITRLDVDFLNDNVPPTACWNINKGAIYEDRLARFHVYALTDDQRFYANVTTEIKSIKFKLHGIKGKFTYSESSNNPTFYFTPKKKMGGKTGSIDISYKCKSPNETYTTRFDLVILPSGDPINEAATLDRRRSQGISPDSVDFLQSLPSLISMPVEDDDTPGARN